MNKQDAYIETYTGNKFHLFGKCLLEIDIIDIAHSLAYQCRYSGHSKTYYSVAEHSLWCSRIAPVGHELHALLHDASEAYLSDIASPFKQFLSNYYELEISVMERVAKRFQLPNYFWRLDDVQKVDMQALKCEAHLLMQSQGSDWPGLEDVEYAPIMNPEKWPIVLGKDPKDAEIAFLKRFAELI